MFAVWRGRDVSWVEWAWQALFGYAVAHNPMTQDRGGPFDTLESAYEFVSLLREAVDDAYGSILDETARAKEIKGAERRLDALRLVDHKLNSLRQNMLASLILLNDLRTLQRLLLGERKGAAHAPEES
jgi:hypothetical protein